MSVSNAERYLVVSWRDEAETENAVKLIALTPEEKLYFMESVESGEHVVLIPQEVVLDALGKKPETYHREENEGYTV